MLSVYVPSHQRAGTKAEALFAAHASRSSLFHKQQRLFLKQAPSMQTGAVDAGPGTNPGSQAVLGYCSWTPQPQQARSRTTTVMRAGKFPDSLSFQDARMPNAPTTQATVRCLDPKKILGFNTQQDRAINAGHC